jgi:hypothetical protein
MIINYYLAQIVGLAHELQNNSNAILNQSFLNKSTIEK